jgi:hypothetical protein
MIMGRDLISELKLILDFDTQCITWDNIDKPMKSQGDLSTETTHYEDLYTALLSPVSTVLYDVHAEIYEPEHVHAAIKRQTRILDAKYEAADLREIVESISTINDTEKGELLRLLQKYEELFDGTLGDWETSPIKLDLKDDAKPYHGKAFPVPKIHHDTLKTEIARLVKLGVLRRCNESEWAAPTFIIPKHNNTVRFISDFRKLNAQLKRKPYPIPKIAQMLQELESFEFATSLDLNMGYYTIRLDPDAQKLCTIVTPFGKYEYLRLPMGISCSPDIFQEKMSSLMQHLDFVKTYLDDILVISCSTFEDHISKLEIVLKLLAEKGLRINAKKSTFCTDQIEYLGYWITKSGIQPMPNKVEAIKNMARPTNCKELIRFIGMVN